MEPRATRRQHYDAAQDRLRSYALVGLSLIGLLIGTVGAAVAIADHQG
ncbi:MAG TPA: hypothetical protein VNO33_12260 [Kofleriaceae bacterium]|nr:hypothetical protein [Kofleriaceae bacterium]